MVIMRQGEKGVSQGFKQCFPWKSEVGKYCVREFLCDSFQWWKDESMYRVLKGQEVVGVKQDQCLVINPKTEEHRDRELEDLPNSKA